MGLKEDILGTQDIRTVPVPTPEWPSANGKLGVKGLTETEKSEWEKLIVVKRRDGEHENNYRIVRAELVWRSVVDIATGQRVFSASDVDALREKSAGVLGRFFDVALKLNGTSEQDIKDLVGNSVAGPSAGCGTGSPAAGAAQ